MEEKKMYQYEYPHPAVTTDCVIFGFDGRELHVLLVERGIDPFKGSWALPGGFLRMDETVEEGARRELVEETRLALPKDIYFEQFHVFSDVHRDPRERVLTVAFYALVRPSDYAVEGGDDARQAQWFLLTDLPPLAFDHSSIIRMAQDRLREKVRTEPIVFKLLDNNFTISELQTLYETILGVHFDRRNFYRKVMNSGLLQSRGISQEKQPNRRPEMYSVDYDDATFHFSQSLTDLPF